MIFIKNSEDFGGVTGVGIKGSGVLNACARLASGDEYLVLVPIGTDVFTWYYDELDTRIEDERAKKREDASYVGISADEFEAELKKHGLEFVKIKS